VASELVVSRPASPSSSGGDTIDGDTIDVRDHQDVTDTPEIVDAVCVICGGEAVEIGACCSSRCAGEAQRQLRRNAARLRRLGRRDAHELRHHLSERNGRLMSAILRWRPDVQGAPLR